MGSRFISRTEQKSYGKDYKDLKDLNGNLAIGQRMKETRK